MPESAAALRECLCAALVLGVLSGALAASPARAEVKSCPLDKAAYDRAGGCPAAGGELVAVTGEVPQTFGFCSICVQCWTGIAVEAGKNYRLRIVGEPERWADGDWTAATAEEALEGWATLSDIPETPWWKHAVAGPFIWMAKGSRPQPEADWFQVFFAVRDAGGSGSDPVRLKEAEQTFTAPRDGELYFFVNDHPDYYVDNNTGRMTLEISLIQP